MQKVSDLGHRGISFLVGRSSVSFGEQARSVLVSLHLKTAAKHASSTAETPGQIAASVVAGETDAFVYASDLTAGVKAKLHVLTVPSGGHPSVTFEIALVKKSTHAAAAQAYIAKVLSPAGRTALRHRGFGPG